jgi:hypothetical protein
VTSQNDTKVSLMAYFIIDMIKAHPGALKDHIITEIDLRFDPTGASTVMRRTYDVLNILQMAEVVKEHNKHYYYNPFVLEGTQAAEDQV